MTGRLIDIIDRLNDIDDSDRFDPPVIYAEGGPRAAADARALVCPGDEQGTLTCPVDPTLSEVLLVFLAKEAIEVWAAWRNGQHPTPEQKFAAVMHYSQHDCYLPLTADAGG